MAATGLSVLKNGSNIEKNALVDRFCMRLAIHAGEGLGAKNAVLQSFTYVFKNR